MDKGKDIVVVAEAANGAPIALVFEMLGLGRQLAAQTGGSVCAVVLGQPLPEVTASLIARGADRVLVMPDAGAADDYQSDAWLARMNAPLAHASARAVLIGHTPMGADLAP